MNVKATWEMASSLLLPQTPTRRNNKTRGANSLPRGAANRRAHQNGTEQSRESRLHCAVNNAMLKTVRRSKMICIYPWWTGWISRTTASSRVTDAWRRVSRPWNHMARLAFSRWRKTFLFRPLQNRTGARDDKMQPLLTVWIISS